MEQIFERSLTKRQIEKETLHQESLWVRASRRGDVQAFNRLVLKWERTIFNLALRILGDREEAAEATQESFLIAYKNIRRFRGESRFSTWLYRIAVNQSFNRLRRRPPMALSLDSERLNPSNHRELQTSGTQDREVLELERKHRVRCALDRLPAEQRVVVELKFYREQTFEEIASILEEPSSTVKSRFYAALEFLKKHLVDLVEE